jgi:hypothetical protein
MDSNRATNNLPRVDQTVQTASWNETAYDWILRCRRKRTNTLTPNDPSSAAWDFVRPSMTNNSSYASTNSNGTGIAFIDTALTRNLTTNVSLDNLHKIPVIDVCGECGKTWTLISLAARFVVTTRPSQFLRPAFDYTEDGDGIIDRSCGNLPHVIILDSKHDVTVSKLAYAVRSTLLRKLDSSNNNNVELKMPFERDMEDCLSRIHVAVSSNDIGGWISVLESIRCELLAVASNHPTLLLWDGFLSEPVGGDAFKMEVVRLLEQLLEECSIFLVITSGHRCYRKREWERFVSHRIRLDRAVVTSSQIVPCNRHDYMATVYGAKIPFSISLAGILS